MTPWLLLAWLSVCALRDARTRNVPNWLTLPTLALGAIGAWQSLASLAFFLTTATTMLWSWHRGLLGGADAKILIALAGFWPEGTIAALVGLAIWVAARRRRFDSPLATLRMQLSGRRREFPAVPAMAIGAGVLQLTRAILRI